MYAFRYANIRQKMLTNNFFNKMIIRKHTPKAVYEVYQKSTPVKVKAASYFQRIYLGVRRGENHLVDQVVMRHAAHLPSFKTSKCATAFADC